MSLLFRPLRAAARTVSASVPAAVRFSSTKRLSIPEPRGGIDSAPKFIEAISTPRRDLSSAPDEWNALFLANSGTLKTAGMSVKDRRYLLWAVEKYRQGFDPSKIAVAPPPKKVVRGWGPRVQTSERIRVRGRRRPGEK